jgi:ABC-2 type transport system permease protein
MRNTWAVFRREFAGYFQTPIGYVVCGVFAAISGLAFTLSLFNYARISQSPGMHGYPTVPDFEESFLSPWLVFCGSLIMFLAPLVTMRLFAEERHRGTIELLLTLPLRDREIILGKYFASLGMLAVMLLVVAADLALVGWLAPVEPAVLLFGTFTVFLMGASFFSVGMFVSSTMNNQVTSGTITFGLFLVLFVSGAISKDLPAQYPAPEAWPDALKLAAAVVYGVVRNLMQEMAIDGHAKDMAQGVLQIRDVAYYVLFSAFFVFLTFRSLESRHWRG